MRTKNEQINNQFIIGSLLFLNLKERYNEKY